jgi:hypothetical protein
MVANRFDILWARVQEEIPGAKIVLRKDSLFLKIIDRLLRILTRNKFDPREFTTTIGKTMYVDGDWYIKSDQERYLTLRHELIHMRQFRRWPFKFLDYPVLRLINLVIFSFCYLLVLPLKWTLRSSFEREAYTQTLLVHYEIAGSYTLDRAMRITAHMSRNFGGPAYFYMWDSHAARKWAAKTMLAIEGGKIKNDRDRVDLA